MRFQASALRITPRNDKSTLIVTARLPDIATITANSGAQGPYPRLWARREVASRAMEVAGARRSESWYIKLPRGPITYSSAPLFDLRPSCGGGLDQSVRYDD